MKRAYILLFGVLVFAFFADSAVIVKVKDRKAFINLEGMKAHPGDRFEALNLYGRALGLLEIQKVKNNKAIAVLLKGQMNAQWILEPAQHALPGRSVASTHHRAKAKSHPPPAQKKNKIRAYRRDDGGGRRYRDSQRGKNPGRYKTSASYKRKGGRYHRQRSGRPESSTGRYSHRRRGGINKQGRRRRALASVDSSYEDLVYEDGSYGVMPQNKEYIYSFQGLGFMAGAHFNSIRISKKTKISGTSWKARLVWDSFFLEDFSLRVGAGYQTLVAGGEDCGSRIRTCRLRIDYPFLSALVRVVFLKSKNFNPWTGVGLSFFWPFPDKKYDLGLDKKSFDSIHGAAIAALGMDFHFKNFYIPVQVDVNWINPASPRAVSEKSRELKPFYISLTVGLSLPFLEIY